MTEQQKLELHQIQGMLEAQLIINGAICRVAEQDKSHPITDYMRGWDTGRISAAETAMRQQQAILQRIKSLLEGVYDA